MRTILIDGDIVLYEVTLACETPIHWGDDLWTLHSDFREATQRFDCWVADIKELLKATAVVIALSDEDNWRKSVLKTYKNNRKSKRKPLVFYELKKYCSEVYKSFQLPTLEADDVLGLLAGTSAAGNSRLGYVSGEKVVVTIDKDLKTIPGLHFDPGNPDDGIYEVTQEQADYNHLFQSLTGDLVDGYKGCPGVGPVKAARILEKDPCWASVVAAYNEKGISEEDALVQARVARILRWGEYNMEKKETRLWNP